MKPYHICISATKGIILSVDMTNIDDELEGGCEDEALSEVQKKAFEDAMKEYERAMLEVTNVQKGIQAKFSFFFVFQ